MKDADALRAESDQLHARVRAFARRWAGIGAHGSATSAVALDVTRLDVEFDELALAIAAFQTRSNGRYRKSVEARGGQPPFSVEQIVPVPSDAFRYANVFSFEETQAVQCFTTSGTSAALTGRHRLRVTETYRELLLLGAARVFAVNPVAPPAVVALAPFGGAQPSSLNFMLRRWMEAFDARSLPQRDSKGFNLEETGRWLIQGSEIDAVSLRRVVEACQRQQVPVWLLATSFALVQLFDAHPAERWPLPEGSVVMQTGGFKGRSRELSPGDVLTEVAQRFNPSQVVNEYGMTELASQLYEKVNAPFSKEDLARVAGSSYYQAPPWLRVIVRDPVTLAATPPGSVGLANFVDLGNVDSALSVLTQDRVQCTPQGVRLLGRNPGAPLRGCSLAIEELFSRDA